MWSKDGGRMIYIGQYKGEQVYHEEPFVATNSYIDKNYSCLKCGARWRGTFESCPSCGNEDVNVSIVSKTGFPELISKKYGG